MDARGLHLQGNYWHHLVIVFYWRHLVIITKLLLIKSVHRDVKVCHNN